MTVNEQQLCSQMRPSTFTEGGLREAARVRAQGRLLPTTTAYSPRKDCKEKTGKRDCFRRVQVPNIQTPMSNWWLMISILRSDLYPEFKSYMQPLLKLLA